MSEQKVAILSVNGYMKKYAIDGIAKGADRQMVRTQMLDAFRREIFDTAVMMVGPQVFSDSYEASEKDKTKLNNILINANKKWKSLCKEFAKYKETEKLIYEEDLMKYMNDRDEFLQEKETTEYVTEEDIEHDEEESEEEPEEVATSGYVAIAEGGEDNGSDETAGPEAE